MTVTVPELAALPSARPYPPANAPRAGNAAPGVQPGSSQTVIAQFVIIFGSEGGEFIYSGQPGPGNPPIYTTSNADTDPYGNPIAPGIWAGQPGSIQVGIQANPGAAQVFFVPAGNYAADASAGIVQTGGQAILELLGAQTTPTGDAASDRVGIFFWDHGSSGAAGAHADLQMVYIYTDGSFINLLDGNYAGTNIPACSGIDAVQPGTGTGPSVRAVTETWHQAALSNSWAGSGSGVNGLFYRLTPDNETEIILDLLHATATGNSVCATLPAGYRPATAINLPLAWNNPQASNSASPPWLNVSTGGALQITGIETANKEIFGRVKFPLGSL
jgi:hypothetical protein